MADMAALERAGTTGAGLTQLYYGLGKLLEQEIEGLKKKGDASRLEQTQDAYQKFLTALVQSKSGQTYESLQWAGENLLTLGAFEEAREVFERILKTFENDKAFLAQPGSGDRLLRTRLKLAAALRGRGDFAAAETLIAQLVDENRKTIEPRIEKAHLAEDKAKAGKATWTQAFNEWRSLAGQLGQRSPKPVEYYEAWYHAAEALEKLDKAPQALQTLSGVLRLSPNVGGPEMKEKYQKKIQKIKDATKNLARGS
jgi:cellulose synthase operon protein C